MRGPDVITRLNSAWRVPLILLATGLLSCLSVCFSLVDGSGRMQHWCARKWAQFIFLVSRVEVEVEGIDRLSERRGYVFAANHLSMFDHWAFLAHLPFQFRFAAKSSLFKVPFLGWHLRRSGSIPIERSRHRKTIESFDRVKEQIKEGISFVIYPEGMRTWNGQTARFKRGSFLLARYAEAAIVPVTIIDAHKRLPRGSVIIRPGKMSVIIHPPLEFDEYRRMDLQRLADQVRSTILTRYPGAPP